MGKDLATNQNRVIATKGTKHQPRTIGATDTCLNPQNGATAPFENHAPMSTLKGHTSVTKIAGDPIWITPAQVGPLTEPQHPPFIIGAASKAPYRMEAKSTSHSPDVYSEGSPVVRTNDQTTQNRKNTVGFVDGSQLKVGEGLTEDLAKKKCSFPDAEGLVGISEKRPLGWPGKNKNGEAYYLEILSGKQVDLTATRVDITAPGRGKNPPCQLEPKHTLWLASRKGGGHPSDTKEGSGPKFVLDSGFTLKAKMFPSLPQADKSLTSSHKGGAVGSFESTGKIGGSVASGSMAAAYEIWKCRKGPAVIDVQAKACAGIKTAQIRVFPAEQVKVSFNLGAEFEREGPAPKVDAFVASIRDKLKQVRKVADIAQNVVKLKPGATMSVKFCVGFALEFELGYKECGEEKETRYKDWKTKAHCGLAWKLAVSSNPLIEFSVKLPISLLELLGPYLAPAVAIARRLEVKADLEFSASASFGISQSVGVDEFDWPTATGGEGTLALCLSGELVISATSKAKLVNAGMSATGEIKPGIFLPDNRDYTAQVRLGGGVKVKFWITLLKDSILEYSKSVEPECLSWKPEGRWNVGKMPSS